MGPRYLGGEVWVAGGKTGHDPDVPGSYQAQGASFLHYIPVAEQRRRVNTDPLYDRGRTQSGGRIKKKKGEMSEHSQSLVLGAVQQNNRTLNPLEGNV